MSQDLNKAATMYVCYWGDVLVAMCAVLPVPSGVLKHGYRPTRTVVLPDYQNLGIGTRLSEFIGDYYLSKGYKFYYRSSHLRLRDYWQKSPYWVATSHNERKGDKNSNLKDNLSIIERVCGSYEYMGKRYLNEHIDIHVDWDDSMDVGRIEEDLKYLLQKKYFLTVITGEVSYDNPIDKLCLKLGIRTQILYYRGKVSSKYSDGKTKIVRTWDSKLSDSIRRHYLGAKVSV